MRISSEGVRLLVDYEVPAGPRAQALRQALRSPAALTEHLSRTATLRTALSLDGAPAALERRAVRAEKVDEPPSSTSLLAVRVELFAAWPAAATQHRLELRDEDESGHVPVVAECLDCHVSDASSGVPDRNLVRAAQTPLQLEVKIEDTLLNSDQRPSDPGRK